MLSPMGGPGALQVEPLQREATHLETSSQVFFSLWMELLCKADRMA